MDCVNRDMRAIGATKDEVHDRTGWRRIVSVAATPIFKWEPLEEEEETHMPEVTVHNGTRFLPRYSFWQPLQQSVHRLNISRLTGFILLRPPYIVPSHVSPCQVHGTT